MGNKFEIITDKKAVLKYFLIFAIMNSALLYYIHDIIITDPQYFTGGNMNSVRLYRNVWNVIYFISPIYSYLKILLISFLIHKAAKVIIKQDVQFWGIFYIVLLAQFLLLIPGLLEMFWFTFVKPDYTMADVDYFSPLSFVNFLNHENISNFTYKLLNTTNLFNALYWGIIVFMLIKLAGIKLKDSLIVVFSYYGAASFVFTFVQFYFIYKFSYGW